MNIAHISKTSSNLNYNDDKKLKNQTMDKIILICNYSYTRSSYQRYIFRYI